MAAGILCDADGCVLLTERVGDAAFAGLWEFPGGKIDAGETADMALQRELREELGIEIAGVDLFQSVQHDYRDRQVDIDFFLVTHWIGEPSGLQGQKLKWLRIDQLDEQSLLAADAPVVIALQKANIPF